ncbi:T9SS type A sorting domain-containing protein [Mangrovimonas sp. AS39]|uniref:T9SS type A sorting domain-containing protein n=1 Tax=Mangrovimonas futianensis TaxID=2895523 RepID=UPI001E469DB8|nr:T9SS type A sorting domain-containing protein [Mangrovimonas futianensis]MCF1190616.1 T9SS type A sorting domain-containing protein [Mangrovimonas futianensis]MCF1194313.1 T9SS type A sorting domain-containing protein [Mangrovimonas futianensis]
MKHTYLLFVLFSLSVQSQIINFPDQTFKDQLLAANIDTNNDGEIQVSEAQEVTSLSVSGYYDVYGSTLTDITGIEYFVNLTHLICSPHEISSVDLSQNTALIHVDFSEPFSSVLDVVSLNEINVYGCSSLEYLNVSNNNIQTIDLSETSSLETLIIYNNQMETIELGQQNNLVSLGASNNSFSELDISQTAINDLNIAGNSESFSLICNEAITEISADEPGSGNLNLVDIDLSNSPNIESLDLMEYRVNSIFLGEDHSNLTHMRFYASDFLSSLDLTSCQNLEFLSLEGITNLELTEVPSLLNLSLGGIAALDLSYCPNLETLSIGGPITSLDFTPVIGNLESLSIGGSWSTIDLSPCVNLVDLTFGGANLTTLDLSQLPNLESITMGNAPLIESLIVGENPNLISFETYMSDAPLDNLDLSQCVNLQSVQILFSNIQSLNIKNGTSEEFLNFYSNEDLIFICADEEQLDLVYAEANSDGWLNVPLTVSSYCSFTPGGNYNTTTGQVQFDLNNDGCQTGTESFSNVLIQVESEDSEEVSYVNSGGNYSFYSQDGSFVLTPSIEHPEWFTITPENAFVVFEDNLNNTTTQDFCISALGTHQDLEVVLTPIGNAQPGFDANYELIYKNNGNQVTSGQVSLTFDTSLMELVSVSQEQDVFNSGELIWNFEDLLPFQSRSISVTFNLNAPTETPPLNIDDVLIFSVEIVGAQEDENPNDNSFELNQTVVGAFDPNDKVCLEGDIAPIEKIGDYLHYTINFENTGNAAATFVVIKDVLNESDYNLNSLQILSASHSMETRMEGNLLEFYFDNIDLGPEEQGHVTYKIKTLESLEVGDTVSNSAEIYFDYNLPIETNEAITSFESLSLIENTVQEGSIKIFPNPTNGVVEIASSLPVKSLEVLDIKGRRLSLAEYNEMHVQLDLGSYKNGMYLIKIQTVNGFHFAKVIKN